MHSFAWWPTVAVLAVATFMDLRVRRIPNWLVFPFLLAGIAVSASLHGWHGMGQSLAGFVLGLGFYGCLFLMGGMGAGDVKLCAAIGVWIGPQQLFFALVLTGLAGGVMAIAWAAYAGFFKDLLKGTADLLLGKGHGGSAEPLRRKMPYAPAIAAGTLLSFFAR